MALLHTNTYHKYTEEAMILGLINYFNPSRYLMVPNVFWSILDYEADLVIVTPRGYATEVEIKVSKSDLKRNDQKTNKHNTLMFQKMYFAIPESLKESIQYIPEHAGILIGRYADHPFHILFNCIREPIKNKNTGALPQETINTLYRLAYFRSIKYMRDKFELKNIVEKLQEKTT